MPNGLFFAFSNPTEGNEEEFNRWYDEVHIHEVAAIPGVIAGQRYTLDPLENAPAPPQRYVAVYEISKPPAEIMQAFMANMAAGTLTVSPALDLTTMSMSFWSPHGPEVKGTAN